MLVMTSMEMDDEEQADVTEPYPAAERPKYPYGLQICLTQDELKKLDLDPQDAVVGGMVHLHAIARVTSASCTQMEGGDERCRIELQITDMAVESEDAENEAADAAEDAPAPRKRLTYAMG